MAVSVLALDSDRVGVGDANVDDDGCSEQRITLLAQGVDQAPPDVRASWVVVALLRTDHPGLAVARDRDGVGIELAVPIEHPLREHHRGVHEPVEIVLRRFGRVVTPRSHRGMLPDRAPRKPAAPTP